jgi:hypothetical protein
MYVLLMIEERLRIIQGNKACGGGLILGGTLQLF